MASVIDKLRNAGVIDPPRHMKTNIQYEVIMGSIAYGCNTDHSDYDVYGFSIPYKNIVFPHLAGYISGFGQQPEKFEQFNTKKSIVYDGIEYDLTIYNIVKFFQLIMKNNPNIIDCLFVPQRCVLHCTQVGDHIRSHRKLMLHKGAWHSFKGYAFSQAKKMRDKNPEPGSKRAKLVELYGYDTKFASHIPRLLNEVEQIMTEGDLDIERNREQLKAIRRGEWTIQEIINYMNTKERELEGLYTTSKLPWGPDEEFMKNLLLECLEMHFGSLEAVFPMEHNIPTLITELDKVLDKYRKVK